jgi:hypothetical protein
MTRHRAVHAEIFLCLFIAACSTRAPQETPPPEPEPQVAEVVEPEQPTPEFAEPAEPDTTPEPPPEEPRQPVRVCAGGDLLLGNNLDTLWAGRASARLGQPVAAFPSPDSLLSPLRPLVSDADVVLLNIEGAIGEGPAPGKCRPGSTTCYAFRQPTEVASALGRFADPAMVVGNVANNHALDAGLEGWHSTLRHLAEAGVEATGADTLPTLVTSPSGRDTIAVLGFSTFRAGIDARDLSGVRRHVARAFARHRRVVVSVHMGAEGRDAQRTSDATEMFLGENRGNPVEFARVATESGAALVIGHGPHVLRGVEWRGDALVFYSLGNLLTYGPFNQREPNSRGGIACAAIDEAGRISGAAFRPTVQRSPGLVSFDLSGRGSFLVDSLSGLDFPEAGARVTVDGQVVRR